MTYIHYGSDHFHPEFFTPIRNGDWHPKPAVGTGLWVSRVDDEFWAGNSGAGRIILIWSASRPLSVSNSPEHQSSRWKIQIS